MGIPVKVPTQPTMSSYHPPSALCLMGLQYVGAQLQNDSMESPRILFFSQASDKKHTHNHPVEPRTLKLDDISHFNSYSCNKGYIQSFLQYRYLPTTSLFLLNIR